MHTCNDFDVKRQIGEGSFGQVYEVRSGTARYALKIRKWKEIYGIPGDILREASFLKQFPHPNIISCYGIFLGNCKNIIVSPIQSRKTSFFRSQNKYSGEIHFLLEYLPSSLSQYIKDSKAKYYGVRIFRFAQDLLRALYFLHNNHFIHGDLKPDNVLISLHPQEMKRKFSFAKLADFGSTRLISLNYLSPFIKGSQSIFFLHPQALYGESFFYSFQSDIYSLSLVLIMMFFTQGQYPFDSNLFFTLFPDIEWLQNEEYEPMEVIFVFLVYILGHPPFVLREDLHLSDLYLSVIKHFPSKGIGLTTFLKQTFKQDPRLNRKPFSKTVKRYLALCETIFSWNPILTIHDIIQQMQILPTRSIKCKGKINDQFKHEISNISQTIEKKIASILESSILHKTCVAIAEKYLFDKPTEWNEKMASLELFICQVAQFEFISLAKRCPSPPISPTFNRQLFQELYQE